jgi:hypothetical protein
MFNSKLRKQLVEANARIEELEKAKAAGLSITEILWMKAEIASFIAKSSPLKAIEMVLLNFDNKIKLYNGSLK